MRSRRVNEEAFKNLVLSSDRPDRFGLGCEQLLGQSKQILYISMDAIAIATHYHLQLHYVRMHLQRRYRVRDRFVRSKGKRQLGFSICEPRSGNVLRLMCSNGKGTHRRC